MYLKNIRSGILLQIYKIIFKFMFSILVARALSTEEYGQITYFFLVFNLLSSYGHLGVINGISYFSKTDLCDIKKQFNTNITYLIFNVMFLFVGICITPLGEIVLPETKWIYQMIGILYVLFNYLYIALEAYYISKEEIYKSNKYISRGLLISSIGLLICFVLNRISFETYLLLHLLEVVVIFVMLYANSGFKYNISFDWDFFKREIKYGNIIFWAALFGYMNYRIDQLMIKFQLGDSQLGVYSVAVTLAELVLLIPNSISSSLSGRLLNAKDEKDAKQIVSLTIKGTMYLCIVVAGIGYFCSPLIGILYGKAYEGASSSFSILLIGVCAAAVGKTVYPYYVVRGKAKIHLFMTILIVCVNTCMNYILIPRYGIEGAAVASNISYFVYGGGYILFLKFKEKVRLRDMLLIQKEDIEMLKRSLRHADRIL